MIPPPPPAPQATTPNRPTWTPPADPPNPPPLSPLPEPPLLLGGGVASKSEETSPPCLGGSSRGASISVALYATKMEKSFSLALVVEAHPKKGGMGAEHLGTIMYFSVLCAHTSMARPCTNAIQCLEWGLEFKCAWTRSWAHGRNMRKIGMTQQPQKIGTMWCALGPPNPSMGGHRRA